MKSKFKFLVLVIILMGGCMGPEQEKNSGAAPDAIRLSSIDKGTRDEAVKALKEQFPLVSDTRIEKGVQQAADFWSEKDGSSDDFKAFCKANFLGTEGDLDLLLKRMNTNLEVLLGCYNKISIALKRPLQLDTYEILPVDEIFAGYEPAAHMNDDMFQNKIAFIVLLNFPFYSLDEMTKLGNDWNSKQWAYARMGSVFTDRVPASLVQKYSQVSSDADNYISNYNIFMGALRDNEGRQLFPKDLKLISHWGLRDELKSHYNDSLGLEKQKMIYEVMLRIINEEIPEQVINSYSYTWDPFTNKVNDGDLDVAITPEPNTRYYYLLENFKALSAMDPYNPFYPNYISRNFDEDMEIPQKEVEALFVKLMSAPEIKQVGELISKRLGRPLQAFDIWYDGFKPRSSVNEAQLDKITMAKYPSREAFEQDLVNILTKLGFPKDSANMIVSHVEVDPSRGAGHAWGAESKEFKAHLRTRIGKSGMNYKGYNIAVHEFGHNVEQVISLFDVDYYILHGVPNTAFTEALAFMFQKKDLELLGMNQKEDEMSMNLEALDNIWSIYEIMGVSMVDMNVWKWMYANPDATPETLKEQVIKIARDIWNQYYAPVFGIKDSPILAIYSHMIDNPLYLSAYPVGHLIQFQIEQYMKDKNFSKEVYRMYSQGKLIPQVWMKRAVGSEISVEPTLEAARKALSEIK